MIYRHHKSGHRLGAFVQPITEVLPGVVELDTKSYLKYIYWYSAMCYDEIWLHASFFTEKAKIDCASWLVPFNRIELNTVKMI